MKTLIGPEERDILILIQKKYKFIYLTENFIVFCEKKDNIFGKIFSRYVFHKNLFKKLEIFKTYKIYDLLFEYDSSCIH